MLNNAGPISINEYFQFIGNICCTNDESKPTPVYVVQGGEAVLQCAFRSDDLSWNMLKDDNFNNIIASAADTIDSSKYSTSTYLSTGLYYRLHILNVEVSDVKKYRCDGIINGVRQIFYLQLDLIGRCNYILVIFNEVKQRFDCC
jgi:hypothetical protein